MLECIPHTYFDNHFDFEFRVDVSLRMLAQHEQNQADFISQTLAVDRMAQYTGDSMMLMLG